MSAGETAFPVILSYTC